MLFKGFRFSDFLFYMKYLLSITEIRKFCFDSGFSLVRHYLYTVLYGLSFVNAILYTMHLLLKKFASISNFNKKINEIYSISEKVKFKRACQFKHTFKVLYRRAHYLKSSFTTFSILGVTKVPGSLKLNFCCK